MDDDQMFESVKATIVDVLDLEDDTAITPATTAEEIEEWDSLQHVRVLTALERKFKFRFADDEVQSLRNVGDLVSVVAKRVREGS